MFLGVFVRWGQGGSCGSKARQIHKTLQNSNHFANAKGFEKKTTIHPDRDPTGDDETLVPAFFFFFGGGVVFNCEVFVVDWY